MVSLWMEQPTHEEEEISDQQKKLFRKFFLRETDCDFSLLAWTSQPIGTTFWIQVKSYI
jgi:hypothetical protein